MELSAQNENLSLIRRELEELEKEPVMLDGKLVKPSLCYRFFANPPYVLYNTNCPEDLMTAVEAILLKYKKAIEVEGSH